MNRYCKTVLINRAVPGSGKTTFSRRIYDAIQGAGLSIAVHSTDEFFMVGNRYEFELTKLGEYHKKNLANFRDSLKNGIDLVVVDNTNLKPWECEPYTLAAREAGYKIVLFNFLPREFEKHLASQQITPDKPDAHQVSAELLERFISEFHLYNDLLDKNFVPDPKVHINCVWDEETMQLKQVDSIVHHFDYDDMLIIDPAEYHTLKDKIGEMMLDRFCRKSWTEEEVRQKCMRLKERILLGRISKFDRGWLMVELNDDTCGLKTYIAANAVKDLSLVPMDKIFNKEFAFTFKRYHEYDKALELESSRLRTPLNVKCDEIENQMFLKQYVAEIVSSIRRDYLYSLKVGNIYYGTVIEVGESYGFRIDLGHDLHVGVLRSEVSDDLRKPVGSIVQIGQNVPVKILAFDEFSGKLQVSLKAALAEQK